MFREIRNTDLSVNPPKFLCDQIISPNIRDPLPNTAFFSAVMGPPGSGKTSLVVNFLTEEGMYRRAFDHVHLVAPKASMGSLKENIWDGHPSDKIHNTMSAQTLLEIKAKLEARQAKKPQPETTLLVIDDMTVHLRKKGVEEILRDLAFNRRHYRLSMVIMVQSYMALPPDLRKTLSHFYTFKPKNKKEAEKIWEELMFMPRQTGDALLRFAFREDHDFLMGDAGSGRVFRNFNEILIEDGFDDSVNLVEHDPDHDPISDPDSDCDR